MIGGALTTAGNLVFAGEGDGSFNAYDATTGDKLWSFQAGAGVNSAPMAFEIDGKLHVAVRRKRPTQLQARRRGPGVRTRLRRRYAVLRAAGTAALFGTSRRRLCGVRLVVFLAYAAALPIADKSVYTKNCLG
jgi:hypothetical protein